MEHPHPCSSNQHSMQTAKEEHPNGYSSYFSVGIRAAFGSETEGDKKQKRNTQTDIPLISLSD